MFGGARHRAGEKVERSIQTFLLAPAPHAQDLDARIHVEEFPTHAFNGNQDRAQRAEEDKRREGESTVRRDASGVVS